MTEYDLPLNCITAILLGLQVDANFLALLRFNGDHFFDLIAIHTPDPDRNIVLARRNGGNIDALPGIGGISLIDHTGTRKIIPVEDNQHRIGVILSGHDLVELQTNGAGIGESRSGSNSIGDRRNRGGTGVGFCAKANNQDYEEEDKLFHYVC